MSLFLLFSIALGEIMAHKFRSILSMLGIILGVSSLIATMALTAGIVRGMRGVMEQIGGLEYVSVVDKEVSAQNAEFKNLSPRRTLMDAEVLKYDTPGIVNVAPEIRHIVTASRDSHAFTERLTGIWPDTFITHNHTLAAGRFICDLDVERAARVVVLGQTIAATLFPGLSPQQIIGRTIYFNGSPFTVVGVPIFYENIREKTRRERQNKGTVASSAIVIPSYDPLYFKNRQMMIPISTMFYEFISGDFPEHTLDTVVISQIYFRVGDLKRFRTTLDRVNSVLLAMHRGVDDFSCETREEWFDSMEEKISAMRWSGGLIAIISLIVGGIGIFNVMLVSIAQRIREIGIRVSVGARQSDIFLQVLFESIFLSFFGGLFGIAVGIGLVQFINIISPQDTPPVIELFSFVIAIVFAAIVGIVSGFYPAWKASRLDPIVAIR